MIQKVMNTEQREHRQKVRAPHNNEDNLNEELGIRERFQKGMNYSKRN